MLRKIANIVLAFLLLLSTAGVTISKHYCGGELKSIALDKNADKCCETPGCCHNETTLFQLKENYTPVSAEPIPMASLNYLPVLPNLILSECLSDNTLVALTFTSESPPFRQKHPLTTLIQAFRL